MTAPGTALLLDRLRERRSALVGLAAWSVVESVPSLLSGLLVAAAVDRLIGKDLPGGLGFLALLLLASLVGVAATRRLFPYLTAVVEPVRDALLTAAVGGAIGSAAAGTAVGAGAVARLTGQVQSVRNLLFALLRTVRQILFTVAAALVGLALLAPLVAVGTAVLILLALGLFGLVLPGLARRHRAVLLAGEEVASRTGAALDGARDVIACGACDRAAGDIAEAVDAEAGRTRALARVFASRHLLVFLGGRLPLVALLAASPWLLRGGRLTAGEIVGAATYLAVGLEPALRGVIGLLGGWGLDLYVNLGRLGETFTRQSTVDEEPGPAPSGGELSVRDVRFAYGPEAAPVVDGLTLTVPYGGSLAVVGASGIGKSTLADLLCGLRSPDRGAIRFGGTDPASLTPSHRRRLVALIPQEAYVFTGTVRENLAYLAPDAADAELLAAAEAVGLAPLLAAHGGLDTRVGAGGIALSAGERQLVALARVHASPARLTVLDEATCHLDPIAEERAERAFAERDGTLVVIAHRISSARRADLVLLLDGRHAYAGTDAELTAGCPPYAALAGHWGAAPARVPAPD